MRAARIIAKDGDLLVLELFTAEVRREGEVAILEPKEYNDLIADSATGKAIREHATNLMKGLVSDG